MTNPENFDEGLTQVAKGKFKAGKSLEQKVPITEFNKDMSKEERDYYGKEFDDER